MAKNSGKDKQLDRYLRNQERSDRENKARVRELLRQTEADVELARMLSAAMNRDRTDADALANFFRG